MKPFLIVIFSLLSLFAFRIISIEKEETKPLLRVWPAYRTEECEWAIQTFICQDCISKGKRYAQLIRFFESGPHRTHGCYTDESGFEERK
jgi:hypothetical protein